ncbi:hypothetical protein A2955_05045 [Candidatus Woesebacteria bacterium RIFCSPLOWO2_01_FULL_37_19]|uniref:Uncharacterized protein n=2 Tax=Candidatus Woeseibacteriota TaxID=1752722 RepID=A0A1F8AZZ0_9BACT|nr:MAG: hypothetical protein A2771_03250 [Candidatus Woesebacteria bacterium RIFCSPHIGHO2_01_FULL_38_26b]OGM57332.1 MAG: hypothetical protein A2955_05045 [Candidatus Woesebacteria bacterium RIFCSPLOWO2_01_FULL_37_19]
MPNQDQTVIYILLLILASFGVLSIALTMAYLRLVQRFISLKEKKDRESGADLIANAQKSAEEIIKNANLKASEIITSAEIFPQQESKLLQQKIAEAAQIYLNKYQEGLTLAQQESAKNLSGISEDIKNAVVGEIAKFSRTIQQETLTSKEKIAQAIKEAYQKAEGDVNDYKEIRFKQVDEKIFILLSEISRKVLSKEISLEEHEKLVIKALEEAKSEGILHEQS